MTIGSAVIKAARRCNAGNLSSVIGSPSDVAKTLIALVDASNKAITRYREWQVLVDEHTWSAALTRVQPDAFPTDFGRMINETFWNRSDQRKVIGPITEADYQRQIATVSAQVQEYFIVRGGSMYFATAPDAADTMAYSYVSNTLVTDSGGTAKAEFDDDTDLFRLDEELLILDLCWRYKKQKGRAWQDSYGEFSAYLATMAAQDKGGNRILPLADESLDTQKPGCPPYVKEGSWSLP